MPANSIHLAQDFAPASRADWTALVERTLKGACPESLVTRAAGGLEIKPLYERPHGAIALPSRAEGGGLDWDVRAAIGYVEPGRANRAILDDLQGGVQSVLIRLAGRGQPGLALAELGQLRDVLDGVLLDVAPVAIDAGFAGPGAADALSACAKGSPAAALAFHMDPIGAFARSGMSPGPIEGHLIAAAGAAARLAGAHPKATHFLATGRAVHEAGGEPALELAFALAAASAYARAMGRAGMPVEACLGALVLGVTVDADPLVSIAKLRAARRLWASFAGAFGNITPARIEARSSRRMLTRAEPWTNMVRLTAAGAAAAIGGADAIVLGNFTDPLGAPTDFARRISRNTQLILRDEGHLGAVVDPTAGSGAFEALSDGIAGAAWSRFARIEADGGLLGVLRDGAIGAEIASARAALAEALRSGGQKIVGVTDYQADPLRSPETEPEPVAEAVEPGARLPGPDSQCPSLKPISVEDLLA